MVRNIALMASGVRDLKVWQEAVLLGGEVVKAMRQCTRREVKGFTDHVMQDAVAVAASIAEGYGHYTNAEQRVYFTRSKRLLATLETQLAIARQAGLLSPTAHASLGPRLSTVSRLLTGYVSYLERQIAVEQEAGETFRPVATSVRPSAHVMPVAVLADQAPQ